MTLIEGKVTNVRNEDGIILLDVERHVGDNLRNVAFGKMSSDIISAPREGDVVTVQKTDQGRYVAGNVISKSNFESPNVKQGSLSFWLNNGSSIEFRRTDEDTFEIDINVEGDISIKSKSNIFVECEGEIKFDKMVK